MTRDIFEYSNLGLGPLLVSSGLFGSRDAEGSYKM